MSSGESVAQVQTAQVEATQVEAAQAPTLGSVESLQPLQSAYQLGEAYDEMFAPGGVTRPHYELLRHRIETLGAEELEDRQQTLERSFLLQGITFTVYGAESSTERIIPTDLFPRIIPAADRPIPPREPG